MNVPDLHCHSTFSMLDGMGTPKDVVNRAVELGWGAVCLTEHGWMGSAPDLYKAAVAQKVKPILGCELYIIPSRDEMKDRAFHLTVLALNREGYFNLVAWNTFANRRENFHRTARISVEELLEIAPHSLTNNVVFSGCIGGELAASILPSDSETSDGNGEWLTAGIAYVDAMRSAFPHFYLEFQNHRSEKRVGKGYEAYENLLAREGIYQQRLAQLAEITGVPVVVTNDSHFQSPGQRATHLAMQAASWRNRSDSHYGTSVEKLASKYAKDYVYWTNYMRSIEKVADGLPKAIRESAVENVHGIVDEADIRLDPFENFSYSIPFSGYEDPVARIRRRCKSRMARLAKEHGRKEIRARFEYELEAMGEFAHYLLLMSDFILYAKRQGILTNTRGSAANSLVCFCLGIHDIDPIRYKLTFSRFFNPARKKLPDIDVDIEDSRYDDFMAYVIERMNELEGEGQVVPISQYGTLANRSSFRMVAETLGIDKETQDEISKLLPQMIDSGMVEDESAAYEMLQEEHPDLYELASGVFDALKSVGPHPCGWVFGTRDRPVEQWIPKILVASSNIQVSAYNAKGVEEFGLVKGDFLRLRTLSVVKNTLTLLGKDALDLHQIPLDDEDTFEMLRDGHTEGVFTLQGKTNRQGCIEVEVESVDDVIATVAIYRPALTRPGFHHVYNNRRKGFDEVEYPHEIVAGVLGESFGMPIYQEQSMELGYAIGMTDAEVDDLYQAIKLAKGIGRGAKEAFSKIKPKFYKRARKVMSEEEADATWELLSTFQGYGFNRGHATSYGVLAVRSAYLRRHHPREFFSALLDVYPEKSRYIAAARGAGFRITAPDINFSKGGFTPGEAYNEIRVGLSRIKGLGVVGVREIVGGQPFASYDDFSNRVSRTAVKAPVREILASIGAFSSLGVKGDSDDLLEFQALGFTLRKPQAFAGCKYRYAGPRSSERWVHEGLARGVDYTESGHSVSKAFWIPPLPEKSKPALYEVKTGYMGKNMMHLLLVVDSNGIPFHIMSPSDKEANTEILKFLAKKCQGCVIVCDGAISKPFLTDGPMGFRFYNVTGAYKGEAQLFHADDRYVYALNELTRRKSRG